MILELELLVVLVVVASFPPPGSRGGGVLSPAGCGTFSFDF